jgi:hypothetical protein
MKKTLWKGLTGTGMLLLALCGSVNAQDRYGRYDDRRDGYYQNDRRSPVDRLQADLNRAEANTRAWGRERGRFDKVRREAAEFERKWASGRYDRGELDDVIGNLQHLVDSRILDRRDRDVLVSDLYQLREFRTQMSRGGDNWRR